MRRSRGTRRRCSTIDQTFYTYALLISSFFFRRDEIFLDAEGDIFFNVLFSIRRKKKFTFLGRCYFSFLSALNTIKILCFTAALQSVFPQTELGTFMTLTKREKERQLTELTMIVTGIRLFNKECGKGGEGIDDCKFMMPLNELKYLIHFICRFNNSSADCIII